MTDVMYDYSVCSKCGQRWQNIDYGCARHQVTCGYPLPPRVESFKAGDRVIWHNQPLPIGRVVDVQPDGLMARVSFDGDTPRECFTRNLTRIQIGGAQ